MAAKRIDPSATRYEGKAKLKYLLPLDDEITDRIKSLSKQYPNMRATSETSDTPGKGRAARTVALQSSITGEVSLWRKQFNPGIVCICSRILRDRQTSSSYWAALVTATRVVAPEPMVLSWRIPVAQHYLRGTISVRDPIVS